MRNLQQKNKPLTRSAFTLVEIIVATVIGVFVAAVAVGTLKAISASSQMVQNNSEQAGEVRFASRRIAADLANLYRDTNPKYTKLVGALVETEKGPASSLTLYTLGRAKARPAEPEGDVYEVEYYLAKQEEKSALMRRLWPNPDKDSQPGGILSPIAENIDVFEVTYYDGRQWLMEWPEEMNSLPELVEVRVGGQQQGENGVTQSFVVNFARDKGTESDVLEQTGQTEGGTENVTTEDQTQSPGPSNSD